MRLAKQKSWRNSCQSIIKCVVDGKRVILRCFNIIHEPGPTNQPWSFWKKSGDRSALDPHLPWEGHPIEQARGSQNILRIMFTTMLFSTYWDLNSEHVYLPTVPIRWFNPAAYISQFVLVSVCQSLYCLFFFSLSLSLFVFCLCLSIPAKEPVFGVDLEPWHWKGSQF